MVLVMILFLPVAVVLLLLKVFLVMKKILKMMVMSISHSFLLHKLPKPPFAGMLCVILHIRTWHNVMRLWFVLEWKA